MTRLDFLELQLVVAERILQKHAVMEKQEFSGTVQTIAATVGEVVDEYLSSRVPFD